MYFDKIFNPFLAAFRSGFGCQSTILRAIEDWKHALDKNEYLKMYTYRSVIACFQHIIFQMNRYYLCLFYSGGKG
jgi:hypothetical protein